MKYQRRLTLISVIKFLGLLLDMIKDIEMDTTYSKMRVLKEKSQSPIEEEMSDTIAK
jgi:hypothetical protein